MTKRVSLKYSLLAGLTVLLCIILTGTLVEIVVRTAMRFHVQETANDADDKSKTESLAEYDLITIGDSLVETGRTGWTLILQQRGWKLLNLGAGSTSPAHYFEVLKNIRSRLDAKQKVAVLLCIGNDFSDQSIWNDLGTNKESYFSRRSDIYSSDNKMYWPMRGNRLSLASGEVKLWLKTHSHAIRLASVLRVALFNRERDSDALTKVMMNQLDRRLVYTSGENFFFIEHHNAISYDANPKLRQAAEQIIAMVASVAGDNRIYFVPVLSREEIGVSIHGQMIRKNAPFIERLKSVNPHIIDVNNEFSNAFTASNLYLPDGHWNSSGHRLFAELLEQHLSSGSL